MEITINQIEKPIINYKKLNKDYILFQLNCTMKFIPKSLLNRLVQENPQILAVSYKKSKEGIWIYLLTDINNSIDVYELRAKLEKMGSQFSQLQKVDFNILKTDAILNILLCLLSSFNIVKGSNILGRLYINSSLTAQKQLTLNEVEFSKELNLQVHSRQFTKIALFKTRKDRRGDLSKFSKGGLGKSARYKIDVKHNSISQISGCYQEGENDDLYLQHPLVKNGKGSLTKFWRSDANFSRLESSIVGIEYSILNKMNEKFSEYLSKLAFKTIEVETLKDPMGQPAHRKELEASIRDIFKDKTIYIKNMTENDEKVEELLKIFSDTTQIFTATKKYKHQPESLKVKLFSPKMQNKNVPTLVLIHDIDWYDHNKKEDQYLKYKGDIVQHIAVENLNGKEVPVLLLNAVKELVIKEMLNTQSTLGWEKMVDVSNFSFYKYYPDQEVTLQYISHGDTFEIRELHPFEDIDPYRKFGLVSGNINAVECIIKDHQNGTFFEVKATDLRTIPNKNYYEALEEGRKVGRGEANLEKYLSGMVNINYYMRNQSIYYNVGEIGKGMNKTLSRASVIRKIHPINSTQATISSIDLEQLLKSMSMTWVRFKHYTVLPYPIKLLNEYYLSNIK